MDAFEIMSPRSALADALQNMAASEERMMKQIASHEEVIAGIKVRLDALRARREEYVAAIKSLEAAAAPPFQMLNIVDAGTFVWRPGPGVAVMDEASP